MATTVQATVTITQVTVTLTCRCWGRRFGDECTPGHDLPVGPSGMPSCPPDCECHDCWLALRDEREARIRQEYREQAARNAILPPPPESEVQLPLLPPPYVGDDIVQTAVETVRPGRAA